MTLSPFWERHRKTIDPDNFRASPQFLDTTGYPHGPMAHYAFGLLDNDERLGRLSVEDEAWGGVEVQVTSTSRPGMVYPVSRDLLDSIVELDVLTRIFGVSSSAPSSRTSAPVTGVSLTGSWKPTRRPSSTAATRFPRRSRSAGVTSSSEA